MGDSMRRAAITVMVASMLASTANAASVRQSCFSTGDIEAAQAIEFQTELMVVSDICSDPAYSDFTQRQSATIQFYQHEMIDHFRRIGSKPAERAFDTYMTRLANEVALIAGKRTVAQVCEAGARVIEAAHKLASAVDFRNYIASQAEANRSNYIVCKN